MKPLNIKLILIFITFFNLINSLSAQNGSVSPEKIDFYINNFLTKGILVDKTEINHLNEEDLILIDNFNFDQYRKLSSIQEIILDNGEKMKLQSLNYQISKGKIIDSELMTLKQNSPNEEGLSKVTIKVIVMLGFKSFDNNEMWETY